MQTATDADADPSAPGTISIARRKGSRRSRSRSAPVSYAESEDEGQLACTDTAFKSSKARDGRRDRGCTASGAPDAMAALAHAAAAAATDSASYTVEGCEELAGSVEGSRGRPSSPSCQHQSHSDGRCDEERYSEGGWVGWVGVWWLAGDPGGTRDRGCALVLQIRQAADELSSAYTTPR